MLWYFLPFFTPSSALTAKGSKQGAFYRPEVAIARGSSLGEGNTGDGSIATLYGAFYAVALQTNGTVRFASESGGVWTEITPLEPFPVLPTTARKIALAFDQAARPVLAWENADQVFVWQFNGSSYITRAFSGVDCCLLCDVQTVGLVGSSDIILFFMDTARVTLKSRVQRELYGTERTMKNLASPTRLEFAFNALAQYKIVLSDVATQALSMLASELYPLNFTDSLSSIDVTPPNLIYESVVDVLTLPLDNLSSTNATPPNLLQYSPVVIVETTPLETLSTADAIPPSLLQYSPVVVVETIPLETLSAIAVLPPNVLQYQEIVLSQNGGIQNLSSISVLPPTGGTYAAV